MIYPLQTFEKDQVNLRAVLLWLYGQIRPIFHVWKNNYKWYNTRRKVYGENRKLNHAGRQMEAIKGDESHGRFSIWCGNRGTGKLQDNYRIIYWFAIKKPQVERRSEGYSQYSGKTWNPNGFCRRIWRWSRFWCRDAESEGRKYSKTNQILSGIDGRTNVEKRWKRFW